MYHYTHYSLDVTRASREVVGVWFDFDILVTVSFFVDILLSFITASKYKRYDAFIAIHSEIARRYLKTWFLLDAVSTIPFDQVNNT